MSGFDALGLQQQTVPQSLDLGGTNAALVAAAGGLVYSTASALAIQAAGTDGYFARSGGTGAPTWFDLFGTANTWTANQTISSTAPSFILTDTTASAKSLTIEVEANVATFKESGGTPVLRLGLANFNVGISQAGATAGVKLNLEASSAADESHLQLAYDQTSALLTAADAFIVFRASNAVVGTIAATAVDGVIAYNTFTGSHYTQVEAADRAELKPLMLLEATGDPLVEFPEIVRDRGTDKERRFKGAAPAHLVRSRISRTKGSKMAYGVWGGIDKEGRDTTLALGTGFCFVANKGNGLEVGDFLISSDVPGACEKQIAGLFGFDLAALPQPVAEVIRHLVARVEELERSGYRNSTVAKVMQPVVWAAGETSRQVACIYLGG